jgi:23S rRNA (uracil1939-C5)-methyltransferase
MSRIVDLEIDSIAAGGDGVGRSDGLVVFVPRSAPGDLARVRIDAGARFARGRLEAITEAGSSRIDPPCAHYVSDRCGGCQLQHILYDGQLEAKAGIIHDSITRIGKRTIDRPAVRRSPRQWRYRRKLTLAMRPRREGSGWIAGLHPFDAPAAVFDLVDCPITDERVLAVWRDVRRAARWLPQARELRGAVRLTDDSLDPDQPSVSFVLEGATQWPAHQRFFDAVPSLSSLWWRPENQSRRRLGVRSVVTPTGVADGDVVDDADVADRDHPDASNADASFVQVNGDVAAELHAHVVTRARAYAPAVVIDAYAGSGDTAVAIAGHGARVTAIELDRDGAARGAARLRAPSAMLQGRVEEILPTVLPADVVILNPPRAGLDARVTAALNEVGERPRAIIYVSCNPATLARDIARLPSYRIASIIGFDMFPQTAHVETVCELVPDFA